MSLRGFHILTFASAIVVLAHFVGAARAQDPFGGEAMPPPRGAVPAADAGAAAGPPPTDDVVILAVRESNPTTPEQLVQAIKSLATYGAHDEAKRYLRQLVAAKPTVADLAAVQRKFGSALFLEWIGDKRLAPEGVTVGQAVLKSAYTLNNDPDRLRQLAQQTGDADAAKREEAIVELRNAGANAVAPLLTVLANKNLPDAQARARDAVVQLGADAVPPLLAALESTDNELRLQAMAILTRLKSDRLLPHLLRPAHDPHEDPRVQAVAREALKRMTGGLPTKDAAEDYLYKKANDYLAGMMPLEPDYNGLVTLWRWDTKDSTIKPGYYPANPKSFVLRELRTPEGLARQLEDAPASIMLAATLAKDLHLLVPDSATYRRLYLVTHLEAAKLMSGAAAPLAMGPGTVHSLLLAEKPAALEDALAWALKNKHAPAAIAACEVLGDLKDPSVLQSSSGVPRPLALALRHADRRVRLAAAEAILKIDPQSSFPGASYVPETLGFIAGSVGSRRALVADPHGENAQTLAGLLGSLGYSVETAATGKDALALALKQPDYELVLLADTLYGPDTSDTWQQLRKDPRTANLVIGILCREDTLPSFKAKADLDDLARAMIYPHDATTLKFQLDQAYRLAGFRFVPHNQRMQQAASALRHLQSIGESGGRVYDVMRQEEPLLRALTTEGLTVHAAPALGALASPKAQQALVDAASDQNLDATDRRACAAAFAAAVKRRGILLTTRSIGAQYDRYNASEKLDADTQAILASVLDTLEQKKIAAE